MDAVRRLLIRFQNRLLMLFLDDCLDELNTVSYPRGHQLLRAVASDPASRPKEGGP